MSSGSVRIDESWKIDLEIALLEDADVFRIRSLCANRPLPSNCRPEVWRICLRPDLQKQRSMSTFAEVFDLSNQERLHVDCANAASKALHNLSNVVVTHAESVNSSADSEAESDYADADADSNINQLPSADQLTSDFESVLTHFAHTYNLDYDPRAGWVSIIRILYQVLRPPDRNDLYACFAAMFHNFIPSGPDTTLHVATLFRILLQYHNPALSGALDSLKINSSSYAVPWIQSLFTESALEDESVILALWDIYILSANPLLGLFVCLVLVLNAEPAILSESDKAVDQDTTIDSSKPSRSIKLDRDETLRLLLNLPKPMQLGDLTSLMEITTLLSRKTPSSFRAQCLDSLFTGHTEQLLPTDGLCMSVSVQDVLEAQASAIKRSTDPSAGELEEGVIRYLLVDCRPADQYNAGHLNTAFFLDSSLLLSDPLQFDKTIIALLQSQERAIKAGSYAAGEHIAILSSGSPEEDGVSNLVIAAFLRLQTRYVSMVAGGYLSLHELLPMNDPRLVSHDPISCTACSKSKPGNLSADQPPTGTTASTATYKFQPRQASKSVGAFLGKFSSTLFGSQQTENKQYEKLSPSNISRGHRGPRELVHTASESSTKTQPSTSYRNTSSVFSIDDDVELDEEDTFVAQEDKLEPNSQNVTEPVGRKRSFWPWRATESNPIPAGDVPSRPGGLDSSEPGDLIDTTRWSCRPEVRRIYDCQLIDQHGQLSRLGYLVIAERHVLLLVDHSDTASPLQFMSSLGWALQSVFGGPSVNAISSLSSAQRPRHALVIRSVPLGLIVRITANKRVPECITLHYSAQDASDLLLLNEQVLGTKDRLFIPKAGDAVHTIKSAICTLTMNMN